jgi:hypothetical protein
LVMRFPGSNSVPLASSGFDFSEFFDYYGFTVI